MSSYTLKCKIPKRLIQLSIDYSKRKDCREKLIKCYTIIYSQYIKEKKRNNRRKNPTPITKLFVPISSIYFTKTISKRYYKHLQFLKSNNFIEPKYGRFLDQFESGGDLFDEGRNTETYRVGDYSKSYRIKEFPIKEDEEFSFEMNPQFDPSTQKNINFLKSIGIDNPKTSKDKYGYRLYHNLFTTYKEVLPKKGEFIYYDIKTSVPSFIKEEMISSGIEDDPFFELFNGDFYSNWKNIMDLKGHRKKIKEQFSTILFGNKKDCSPTLMKQIKKLFPTLYFRLNSNDYGKKIMRMETYYMMNLIVPQIPLNEVLTIFDGFIVDRKKEEIVDEFLNNCSLINSNILIEKSEI